MNTRFMECISKMAEFMHFGESRTCILIFQSYTMRKLVGKE